MAIFLLGPDPNGSCCGCENRISPCDNCGCGISCRIYSGTASLIGFHEFTGISSPPKTYLSVTNDGFYESTIQSFGGLPCNPSGGFTCIHFKETYGGTATIDSGNGVCDNLSYSYTQNNTNPSSCSLGPIEEDFGCAPVASYYLDIPSNINPTSYTVQLSDSGPLFCSEGQGGIYSLDLDITSTLSSEDSDSNAIYRLEQAASWSSWINTTGTDCLAFSYPRTTGYDFSCQVVQWRSITSGYTPFSSHEANLQIYRRVLGSSSEYSLYQTITIEENATIAGILSISGYVSNDPGFESYACGLSIH